MLSFFRMLDDLACDAGGSLIFEVFEGKNSFLLQDSDFLVFLVVFVCGGYGKKMKSSKKFANFLILAILRVKSLR